MKKNERGILTIEASIVLCLLTLFTLFLFNFARVYRAENMVSHATLQAADAVALESFARETSFENDAHKVLFWANRLNGVTTIEDDAFESLRSADVDKILKTKFASAVGATQEEAQATLSSLGVKGGLDGVDFSASQVDLTTNNILVKADYTVKLQFPVFGASELKLTKAAKAKTFGEILFDLYVLPEEEYMGVTHGTGSYRLHSEVVISTEPNYGFVFTAWDDGNTENPRSVTVMEEATYVAQYDLDNFGVTLFIEDATAEGGQVKGENRYGTVSVNGTKGGGEYPYQSTVTVQAKENPGYSFVRWEGTKTTATGTETFVKDKSECRSLGGGVYAFDAYMDGTYTLTAKYKPNEYTASVTTNCDAAKNSIGIRKAGTTLYDKSVTLEYENQIELTTNAGLSGYTFLGWYKGGTRISTEAKVRIPLPVGGGTYEAKYEKDPIVTIQSTGGGSAYIVANGNNYSSSYCGKKGTLVTLVATPNTGYYLVRWEKSTNGGASYSQVSGGQNLVFPLYQDVIYRAVFEKLIHEVRFDVNGGKYAIPSLWVEHGKTISGFPTPVPNGKQFVSWQLNGSNCSSVTVTSNITLVAKWRGCTGHVEGHCGQRHWITPYFNPYRPKEGHHWYGGHNQYFRTCCICVKCGKKLWNYCGSCTSWKVYPWVNVHGLSQMDNIWSNS